MASVKVSTLLFGISSIVLLMVLVEIIGVYFIGPFVLGMMPYLIRLGNVLGSLLLIAALVTAMLAVMFPKHVHFTRGLGGGWSFGLGYRCGGYREHLLMFGPFTLHVSVPKFEDNQEAKS